MSIPDITVLKSHIRSVCGLTFDADKASVLKGAVQSRMNLLNIDKVGEYVKIAIKDEQEFQLLVNLLTINETYFFRETQHLTLLTDKLLPRLLKDSPVNKKVRILCAGCSTGEEPYSLSISILEKFGMNLAHRFAITGADIDSSVLARAANAVYSGLSFRNMPAEMAAKWFTPTGASRYRLNDLARSMVHFHRLNLLDEEYPQELSHQDIIMFRNVSIYFDADVRQSVQSKLAGLLNPGGALIVGLSETLANDFGQLSMVSEDGIFFFTNTPVVVQSKEIIKPVSNPAPSLNKQFPPPIRRSRIDAVNGEIPVKTLIKETSQKTTASFNQSIDEALSFLKDKRYDDALAVIDLLEAQDSLDVRLFVMRSLIAFNRKDFQGAKSAAERALTISEWNLDALFMLAQISRRNDDYVESERRLKQIIYNEPRCWPAHYWLAEVYRNKGDMDKAAREYRVVVNQTSGVCDANGGLLLFSLGVSPAEVGGLCSHQLKSLGVTR